MEVEVSIGSLEVIEQLRNSLLFEKGERIEVLIVVGCFPHLSIPSVLNNFDKLVFGFVVLDGGGGKVLGHFEPLLKKGFVFFCKIDIVASDGFFWVAKKNALDDSGGFGGELGQDVVEEIGKEVDDVAGGCSSDEGVGGRVENGSTSLQGFLHCVREDLLGFAEEFGDWGEDLLVLILVDGGTG